MTTILFFKNSKGEEEIKDYICELLAKAKTSKQSRIQSDKILQYIKALEQKGTKIGSPIVKHIEGDIWELRPLENRIFYFCWQNDNYVLLHHFIKKSQKTPKKEIEQAKRNLATFLSQVQKE
jgi:phage-related protein